MTKKSDPFNDVKASARKIWLAGMGALSEAEKESDKLFQSLVKKGREYEGAVRKNAGTAGEAVRGSVTAARKEAGRGMERMESLFEEQLAAAMKRLGIASREEVESLRAEVRRLRAGPGKAKKAPRASRSKTSRAAASKKRKKKAAKTGKKTSTGKKKS